jgi:malate dehydrogenase (quinone)
MMDVAATNMPIGTDVNFGELTRSMFNYLTSLEGVTMHFNHEVRKIDKREDKTWRLKVTVIYLVVRRKRYTVSFHWCRWWLITIIRKKADVPEGKGYGGFPVSGQWLKCTNRGDCKT